MDMEVPDIQPLDLLVDEHAYNQQAADKLDQLQVHTGRIVIARFNHHYPETTQADYAEDMLVTIGETVSIRGLYRVIKFSALVSTNPPTSETIAIDTQGRLTDHRLAADWGYLLPAEDSTVFSELVQSLYDEQRRLIRDEQLQLKIFRRQLARSW